MVIGLPAIWELSGEGISKSFADRAFCEDMVISFYIKCLMSTENSLRTVSASYRIIRGPKISVSENFL
jgi:hypothetical protein